MSTTRTIAATAATVALTFTVGTAGVADPVDVLSNAIYICQDATEWYTGELDNTYFGAFDVQDVTIYDAAGCSGSYLQDDGFDDVWAVWLGDTGDPADWEYYGDPTGLTEFIVDRSTAGNGDAIVLGPVESHYGLDVQVEQRFYADGDLVRVLATYTNPTGAPITVHTGTDNGYGSDDAINFVATSSGDTTVATGDSWSVLSDLDETDPVLSNAWQLSGAAWNASSLDVYAWHGTEDNLWTEGELTVPAGDVARLAYFSKVYGYGTTILNQLAPDAPDKAEPMAADGLAAATYIGTNMAEAEATAVLGVSEYESFSGRLTAGLAVGTFVANWGTVRAAAATPVVGAPAYTG
jgi:hypothetical protein